MKSINSNFMFSVDEYPEIALLTCYVQFPALELIDSEIHLMETEARDALIIAQWMKDKKAFIANLYEGSIKNPIFNRRIQCVYISSRYLPRDWEIKDKVTRLQVALKMYPI